MSRTRRREDPSNPRVKTLKKPRFDGLQHGVIIPFKWMLTNDGSGKRTIVHLESGEATELDDKMFGILWLLMNDWREDRRAGFNLDGATEDSRSEETVGS